MEGTPTTNYAANAVACKLWGLVESPTEMILGLAIFDRLSRFYDKWPCWVYSEAEFQKLGSSTTRNERAGSFAIVPQLTVPTIGRLDFAIFIPGLDWRKPLVVIECDGHDFHERTVEQASKDRKRDRALLRFDVPVLRFTGTDVVRGSAEFAQEIADFIDERSDEKEARWFQDNGIDVNAAFQEKRGFHVPYLWPRMKVGSELSGG